MNRNSRSKIADETLEIIERGQYTVDGTDVSIEKELEHAVPQSTCYPPDELDRLTERLEKTGR